MSTEKIYTGNIDSITGSYVLCLDNIYSICSGAVGKKIKRSSIIGYVSFNKNIDECSVISFLHENKFITIVSISRFILTQKGCDEVNGQFLNLDPKNTTGVRNQTSFDVHDTSFLSNLIEAVIKGLIIEAFKYLFDGIFSFLKVKIYNKYFNSELKECFKKNLEKDKK